MEIKNCKGCGHPISSKAKTCPQCGHPNQISGFAKFGVAVGILILFFWFLTILVQSKKTEEIKNFSGNIDTENSVLKHPKTNDTPDDETQKNSEINEGKKCWNDKSCLAEKSATYAQYQCKKDIEKNSNYDVKWTNSFLEPIFSKYKWINFGHRIIALSGDKVQFQNEFGAYQKITYRCDVALTFNKDRPSDLTVNVVEIHVPYKPVISDSEESDSGHSEPDINSTSNPMLISDSEQKPQPGWCPHSKTDVERIICNSEELSQLDNKYTALYKKVMAVTTDKTLYHMIEKLRQDERDHCTDAACIKSAYIVMINFLNRQQ